MTLLVELRRRGQAAQLMTLDTYLDLPLDMAEGEPVLVHQCDGCKDVRPVGSFDELVAQLVGSAARRKENSGR